MCEGAVKLATDYLSRADGMRTPDTIVVATNLPHMILNDEALSPAEKRDTLASWASDRRAVMDRPALRQLDNGTIVRVDDIFDALKALDNSPAPNAPNGRLSPQRPFWQQASSTLARQITNTIKRSRQDDDPPPCPAGAAGPLNPRSLIGGASALAEVC